MYTYWSNKLESFWQRRKWWIISALCLIAAAGVIAPRIVQNAETQPPQYVTDSINFVNARARFDAYSTKFVEVNKLSGGMADQMRDSVNIYYRLADSLKTVYESSRPR